ncbi:MFS general substrate transporter [Rozella allomycis CSF55]|uniref:Lysosomal dipeptide transporter MFSD1 n=1 Tax=Rozella allomycis (strain CSF55) TaxID=988480 RepID=A0A4P9YS27_ROZAC|nr:MFS general substrate transporter [Rozella allomycis CSF55]
MSKYDQWIILFFSCFIVFGSYYCYDIPASLNKPIHKYMNTTYDEHQYQLNLLYSVYSFPNTILPLIGGILVDKYGTTTTLIVFGILVVFGHFIFSIGLTLKSFPTMLLGRFVFGLGGETLEVSQTSIVSEYF